jgi:hypothetical protein
MMGLHGFGDDSQARRHGSIAWRWLVLVSCFDPGIATAGAVQYHKVYEHDDLYIGRFLRLK